MWKPSSHAMALVWEYQTSAPAMAARRTHSKRLPTMGSECNIRGHDEPTDRGTGLVTAVAGRFVSPAQSKSGKMLCLTLQRLQRLQYVAVYQPSDHLLDDDDEDSIERVLPL